MNSLTPAQTTLQRLLDIIAQLRGPKGCPWDRAQTKETLRPYLLEETYEVLDAIDGNNPAELCEELGDLLLQIVLLAQLHQEAGLFTFADVGRGICEKLVRRHPHVFSAPGQELSAGELDRQWQRLKEEERRNSPKTPRPPLQALPSLLLAQSCAGGPGAVQTPQPDELRALLEQFLCARQSAPVETLEETLAELLLSLVRSVAPLEINAELALRRRIIQQQKSIQTEKS
jgi:MazG family protein